MYTDEFINIGDYELRTPSITVDEVSSSLLIFNEESSII